MTVNVYDLRLRMTRLASILRGVWVIVIVPGAAGWGVGGGGGILSYHQLHFRLSDAHPD